MSTRNIEVTGSRTVSGDTLIGREDTTNDSQSQFVSENLELLDRDFSLVPLLGEEPGKPTITKGDLKRRKSTRSGMLEKASDMVESAKSALGKRGREVVETGSATLQSLKRRRSTMQTKETEIPSFEGPSKKKARLSFALDTKEPQAAAESEQRAIRKLPSKKWLGKGLYVGQDRDFDPRLTEAKNKLKNATKAQEKPRQRSILPLPMFAGQRTIENGRHFKLPFDIFSPLPPGQPKPDEWRKTRKSKYYVMFTCFPLTGFRCLRRRCSRGVEEGKAA